MLAYDKIKAKKQRKQEEEERLAQELKEIRLQRQYLNASKAMVEEKAFKELERGAEREARTKQNDALIDQCKMNGVKVKDLSIRAKNNRDEVVEHVRKTQSYREQVETKKRENEILHKGDLAYKTQMYQKQRKFEDGLADTQAKRRPFNQKINDQSVTNARTFVSTKHGLTRAPDTLRQVEEDEIIEEEEELSGGLLEEEAAEGPDAIEAKLEAEAV